MLRDGRSRWAKPAFLSNTLVGFEIAPNEAFFAEMWMPLVCFCYGVAAMHRERKGAVDEAPNIEAKSLPELKSAVLADRRFAEEVIAHALASIPEQRFSVTEEERLLDVELVTAVSEHFSGQIVQERRGAGTAWGTTLPWGTRFGELEVRFLPPGPSLRALEPAGEKTSNALVDRPASCL